MKKIFSFWLMILSLIIYSQQNKIDSLKRVVETSKVDTIKSDALSKLMINYYTIDLNKSKFYCDSLINYSKRINDELRLALGYRMQGTFYLLEGNLEESELKYNKSLELSKKLNNRKLEAILYGNLATLKTKFQKDNEAIILYQKSINTLKSINKEEETINSYLNLGIIYNRLKKNETAINYFIKALKIADFKNDKINQSYIYRSIGNIYLEQKAFKKAYKNLKKAEAISIETENNDALMRVYNSLGYYYETINENYENALKYYLLSLKYAGIRKNNSFQISANYNVGLQYIRKKDFKNAENYTLSGIEKCDTVNNKQQYIYGLLQLAQINLENNNLTFAKKNSIKAEKLLKNKSKTHFKEQYLRLSESFERKKKYDDAYTFLKKYVVLNDSLLVKENIVKLYDVEEFYQTEKKEKENLQLKQDNTQKKLTIKKQTRFSWGFGLGFFVFLVISCIIYLKNKKIKKQKEITELQKNEIEKQKELVDFLHKELHHNIKNNLTIINSFVEFSQKDIKDLKTLERLNQLKSRVNSIFELHKILYGNKFSNKISMLTFINKIIKNLQDVFSDATVIVENQISSEKFLDSKQSLAIGLIINEFVTNSYKHAFENIEFPKIIINLYDDDNFYILNLSDNGNGLSENFEVKKQTTFGTTIIKLLTLQLNGTLENNNNAEGVEYKIKFPKDEN